MRKNKKTLETGAPRMKSLGYVLITVWVDRELAELVARSIDDNHPGMKQSEFVRLSLREFCAKYQTEGTIKKKAAKPGLKKGGTK